MKRRSPSSTARGKNRVDGVKKVLVEDLLNDCVRIGGRMNGRSEVDEKECLDGRFEDSHRMECGKFRGTLKVLGGARCGESQSPETSRSVRSLSRSNPASVDETRSSSLTSTEGQRICRGEVPCFGEPWRGRRDLERCKESSGGSCHDSEISPGPLLCLDEGINRILVSAVSAVANSNTSEIQRLQVLLLQEENSILRREVAKARREIDLKDMRIRSLEKSLKAINDLLVGLVKSGGGIRLGREQEWRAESSHHSNEGRRAVSKSNCEEVVTRSPKAADSLSSLKCVEKSVRDEQHGDFKLLDNKNPDPSSTPLICETKEKFGEPPFGESRFATYFRRRQQDQNHSRSKIDLRNDLPAIVSPVSLAMSSSSGNECSSRHRLSLGDSHLSLGDSHKSNSAKSGFKAVPKLESTDEVDFTISNDTVGGGCGRSCVYYYSSEVDNELPSSSRGGSNANSLSIERGTTGDDGPTPPTRLGTMADFYCSGRQESSSISSPPLTPNDHLPRNDDDLHHHPLADQSTPITDTTKASSVDVCFTPPAATRFRLVPVLKLGAVGESDWMSGRHTAGETYQISYDADGEPSSGQP